MVSKDKERINFTISKADKEKLQHIANNDNRSLSNTINVAIKEYIKAHYTEPAPK
ncbi:MAG: hypothetical protein J6X66_04020 [Lachnospiraceae bacterium]|nr:hypothetical protein [Lachnospiraceae bacterium]